MSIIYLLSNWLVCLKCMFWREIIVLAEWYFKLDFWGIISGNVYRRKQAELYTLNRAGIRTKMTGVNRPSCAANWAKFSY